MHETRTPCLRQFTKGLEAPSFSLFERIFAIRRISVAKSRKPVEIACTGFPCSRFQTSKCNLHSTQYLMARVVIGIGVNTDGTPVGIYAGEDYTISSVIRYRPKSDSAAPLFSAGWCPSSATPQAGRSRELGPTVPVSRQAGGQMSCAVGRRST